MNWNDYYMEQAGGGSDYNTYRGSLYQRGYGMGGIWNRLMKWVIPLVTRNAVPLLKEAGKAVGKEALGSVVNIAKDALVGKSVKDSLKENANTAIDNLKLKAYDGIDNLKLKAENALSGKGIKRRRSMKKMIILKKRNNKRKKFDDIFNNAN